MPRRCLVERQASRVGPSPPLPPTRVPLPRRPPAVKPYAHESRKMYWSPEQDSLVFLPPADDANRATVPSRRSSVARAPFPLQFSVSFPAVSCQSRRQSPAAVLFASCIVTPPSPRHSRRSRRCHTRTSAFPTLPPSFSFSLDHFAARPTPVLTHTRPTKDLVLQYLCWYSPGEAVVQDCMEQCVGAC